MNCTGVWHASETRQQKFPRKWLRLMKVAGGENIGRWRANCFETRESRRCLHWKSLIEQVIELFSSVIVTPATRRNMVIGRRRCWASKCRTRALSLTMSHPLTSPGNGEGPRRAAKRGYITWSGLRFSQTSTSTTEGRKDEMVSSLNRAVCSRTLTGNGAPSGLMHQAQCMDILRGVD